MSRGQRRKGKGVDRGAVDDGNWIDPAEARCRLIVGIEAATDLEPLLGIEAVAAFLVRPADVAIARQLVVVAHDTGRAALLTDRADVVQELGADGVLLSAAAEVAATRRLLDQGELIGAVVGSSRHDAMVAGEDGADYVLFGTLDAAPPGGITALVDLVAWWNELAVLPAVAAGRFGALEVAALVRAGADFILPARDSDVVALAAVLERMPAEQR